MTKNRGDEPVRVIIHVYMEMHKKTPCVDILNKQKCHFFLSFFFYEIREQDSEQVLGWGKLGTSERGRR
jgi:hypothetical protein